MLGPSDVKIKGSAAQASPSVTKQTWVPSLYILFIIYIIFSVYRFSSPQSTPHKDGDRQRHAVCCTYPLQCLRTFTTRQFTQLLILQYFPFFSSDLCVNFFVLLSPPRPKIQTILTNSVPTSHETRSFSTKTLNRHLLLIWYEYKTLSGQNAEFLNGVAQIVARVDTIHIKWRGSCSAAANEFCRCRMQWAAGDAHNSGK